MSRLRAALAVATRRPWTILAAAIGYLLVSAAICFPQEQLTPQQQLVLRTDMTTEQGLTAKTVLLSYVVSEHERIGITYIPLRGRWIDPIGSLTRVAQSSLKGMGITDAQPLVTTWRGHQTATASGSVKASQGSVNAAVRVVEGAGVQGSWTLLAISTRSLPDAQVLLTALEEKSVLE
jgi:hypothetical protein